MNHRIRIRQYLEDWTEIEEKCIKPHSTDIELEKLSDQIFANAFYNERITLIGDIFTALKDIIDFRVFRG